MLGRDDQGMLGNVRVFRAIEEPQKTSDPKQTYQEEREREEPHKTLLSS